MSDEIQQPNQPPMQEPSVLDYVKSLFRFGAAERIRIPEFVEDVQEFRLDETIIRPSEDLQVSSKPSTVSFRFSKTPFPWRSLLALLLALIAQTTFEPPPDNIARGIALYIIAFSFLGWGIYRNEWMLAPLANTSQGTDPLTYRGLLLILSVGLTLVGFLIFGGNLFTKLNVTVWVLAIVFLFWAFWLNKNSLRSTFGNLGSFFQRDLWTINISRWTILIIAATALVFFFRFSQTPSVPPEPFSDHAEKIQDIYDVSQGQTHIFFIRNTGREAFQMYWTLLVAKLFGTGLSFLSLKLGTAILGFLTLPFIYLLGKEIGGQRVGLLAFILAGIGYWPNVISRVGLRFPLYPLFVAPTLLYLIRGLRTRNRNDFLLSGLFLGIGLHGYSPIRIMPFVVIAAFVLYWLHSQSKGARRQLIFWLTLLGLVSLVVFLPLLRYWVDDPGMFGFRAFSRLTASENPFTEPVWKVFLSNLWNALRMFNYDDGDIWVHSVPHRPALDVVSGALLLFGVALILVRYIRNRHWLDLFLLVSIPLLLMPSILSLAFPGENPALNRAGGAYVPVFVVGAMALDGLLTSFGHGRMRMVAAWGMTLILVYFSASQNYDLVFRQYNDLFRQSSWNSSDMGKVIKEFGETYGRTDTVWVVPFPYWVDTRLPGVWAGVPNKDFAMWREDIESSVELGRPKLFMVKASLEDPNANDQASLDLLKLLYPSGQLRLFDSEIPGHDFWIFFVPNQ